MTEPIKVIESTTSSSSRSSNSETMRTQDNSNNKRLFVGSLPKDKSQKEVLQAMRSLTKGVTDVIMYASQQDRNRNRGYAFVEFESHDAAVTAREELQAKPPKLWGGPEIKVDWAEPENEVDDETMSKVKVLFVRNLAQMTSEEYLRQQFSVYGLIERVKKQNDYAFIHFCDRQDAERALVAKNNSIMDGSLIEVMWSKPVKNRDQYKQRRGDRIQGAPMLQLSALPTMLRYQPSTAFQQYLMNFQSQRPLQHQLLTSPSPLHSENSLPLSLLSGYNYPVPHQSPAFTTAAQQLNFQAMAAASAAAAMHTHTPTGHQQQRHPQQHQQEGFSEDTQRVAQQFVQPLGTGPAPGAVRASVSPHVHTRPYTVPSGMHHHLQQQQQPLPHTVAQQHLQALPQQQFFAAGYDLSNGGGSYHPAFAVYPPPAATLPYFAPSPQQGQEFFRPHYPEH